jgi:formyl-CoA transferase
MIERIVTQGGLALDVPGIVPKLGLTPGRIGSPAPALGEHTQSVKKALRR